MEAIIIDFDSDFELEGYILDIDSDGWAWDDEMFEVMKSGMYGEMPVIKIGKYTIAEMSDAENEDSVWIEDTNAKDGGQFRKEKILPILDKFFLDNL